MQPDSISPFLQSINGQYAFYSAREGQPPLILTNCQCFPAASLIKVPILLAWLHLEQQGLVSRAELCDLDSQPQVQGAGFAWQFQTRCLRYADMLLMMMALSDNLCANLVIERAGMERLNRVFQEALGLKGARLQRKMMDVEARQRGIDNWITFQDCITLFDCIQALAPAEQHWVEQVLSACQDNTLLCRDIPRDTITFYHKTGSLPRLLHDWGYTRDVRIFVLTNQVDNEIQTARLIGEIGRLGLMV